MKNNRNPYNNTAANRKNAFFAKKLMAALAALCVLSALAGVMGSVPFRAANRTASFEGGAVVQAEQSRQQRTERGASAAQKCTALSASAPQEDISGSVSPSDTAPGGSSFRLQWYHYAIAAGAILIMTIITFAGVKPAGKKQ